MKKKPSAVLAIGALLASSVALAVPVEWTDWETIDDTSAFGVMGGVTVTVSATAVMNGVSQTGCGTNYWIEPNPSDPAYTGGSVDNAPTNCEQVGLAYANTVTVTFSEAVSELYMALLSVGAPWLEVTYDFDQAFVIDSEGAGYWGNDIYDGILGSGDTLAMKEFHGVLMFTRPISTLTFSTAPFEGWHAFTFGSGPSEVPEPGSLILFGSGLLGLFMARRRKVV